MLTRIEVKEILENWGLGLTNNQISEKMKINSLSIVSTLNRYNRASNRYELIDESKIHHLLIGSYLGDGHFSEKIRKGESNLVLSHSIQQIEYLNWKYNKLKEVSLQGCIRRTDYLSKLGKSCTLFTTKSKTHPVFSKFRKEGYLKDNRLNFKLIDGINEESFSIWFFDDGSVTNDGVSIACRSIRYDDKVQLQRLLFKNLQIKVNVTPNTLYIPKSEIEKFVKIVNPYCLESMKYKLYPYHQRGAHVKQGELLENPEEDNQQPSLDSNIFEGSTTNSRVHK